MKTLSQMGRSTLAERARQHVRKTKNQQPGALVKKLGMVRGQEAPRAMQIATQLKCQAVNL